MSSLLVIALRQLETASHYLEKISQFLFHTLVDFVDDRKFRPKDIPVLRQRRTNIILRYCAKYKYSGPCEGRKSYGWEQIVSIYCEGRYCVSPIK